MNILVTGALAAGLLLAPTADPVSVTPGWAGYVVRTDSSIESVRGTWIQPRVVCNRPESSAAFWVGLGGATADSEKLEQIGTSADCSASARVSYSAWYQLFPARAIDVPLTIRPGDSLTAEVAVDGNTVKLSLRNASTGASFSTERSMRAPETDSAEWIVEAPAVCFVTCTRLPLAQFARTRFTRAFVTAESHSGRPGDQAWKRQRFELRTRNTIARPLTFSEDGSAFDIVRLAARSDGTKVKL